MIFYNEWWDLLLRDAIIMGFKPLILFTNIGQHDWKTRDSRNQPDIPFRV